MTDPTKSETAAAIAPSAKFLAAIAPFVTRLGKTPEEIAAALKPLIGDPTDGNVEVLCDADSVSNEDFVTAFAGSPKAVVLKAVKEMREANAPPPVAAPAAPPPAAAVVEQPSFASVLARPRDRKGKSFLTGLSVESVAKVDSDTVGVGIEVALAGQFRVFEVPKVILEMMDTFVSERMEEAAPPAYYELEREVARQDNGAVLAVLKVDGRFVSQSSKNEFLNRIAHIWAPLREFNRLLDGWVATYNQAAGNPAAMMAAISAIGTGRRIVTATAIPNTATLHGSAQLVTKAINRAFAGKAIPAALALGYDAERITEYLTNPDIVRYTGCTNREELAQELTRRLGGEAVPTEFQSVGDALEQFVLTVYNFERYATKGSPQEADVILGLWQIGQGLPWDRFPVTTPSKPSNGHAATRRDPNEPYPMGSGRRDNPLGTTGR